MRIFITGINGFIASHLANHLHRVGNFVYGIDNNTHASKNKLESEIIVDYGDVRYNEDIYQHVKASDVVMHLAAQINVDKSIAHPQETMDINLYGTQNILNACKEFNKTMIFASTSEVYGGHDFPINESSPTYAQSPYAVSKLGADKLCGNYHTLYGLKVYRLRSFNTFGPYQSEDEYGAVIPKFVKNILNNEPPVIFGDGSQGRDFMYISDAVRAYEFLLSKEELIGEPVNVGTGEVISIANLAYMIGDIMGKTVKPVYVKKREGEVHQLQADVSLIKSKGFKLKIGFREGLEKYIRWYEKNKS